MLWFVLAFPNFLLSLLAILRLNVLLWFLSAVLALLLNPLFVFRFLGLAVDLWSPQGCDTRG